MGRRLAGSCAPLRSGERKGPSRWAPSILAPGAFVAPERASRKRGGAPGRRDERGQERGGARLRQPAGQAFQGFPVGANVHAKGAVYLQLDEPRTDEALYLSYVGRQIRDARITDHVQDFPTPEDHGGTAQRLRC